MTTVVFLVATAVAGMGVVACAEEGPANPARPVSAHGDDLRIRARELQDELPARLDQDSFTFLTWVTHELLTGTGEDRAEQMLLAAVNPGCTTEDLGKLFLALDAIDWEPDDVTFFKRCQRPREGLPEIEFVLLPEGVFSMGSPPQERGRSKAEGPQHETRVGAFRLAARPVTNAQFESFDPHHGREEWKDSSDLDHHPVVNVSWWDAYVFCRWLGARLPSEAEWEYACRAGTTTRFSSGDRAADLATVGWFFDNAEQRTHAVGTRPANDWMLHDMHGNTFEWCQDAWHDSYQEAPIDGTPWSASASAKRVYRGGAWIYYAEYARSAFRAGWLPTERNNYLGFRVAMDP